MTDFGNPSMFVKGGNGPAPQWDQVGESWGAKPHWIGEMDPSSQNPLDVNETPNLMKGVTSSTWTDVTFQAQSFGDEMAQPGG